MARFLLLYLTTDFGIEPKKVNNQWVSTRTAATTYYVYDAMGQMAVEYSTQATTTPGTSYMFTDMLGSVRTITDQTGAVVENYDYLPFGRMLSGSQNGRGNVNLHFPANPDTNLNSVTPQKFTGKERDAETGLDFFLARYYSPAQGRFMSPDDIYNDTDVNDPSSWNRYVYVKNNPMKYVDPDGRVAWLAVAAVAWAVYEVGSQIYDTYNAIKTVANPKVAPAVKAAAVSGALIGLVSPGGGYGTVGKKVVGEVVEEASGKIGKAAVLEANKKIGKAAEKKVEKELLEEGRNVVGSQVSIQTSKGRRVSDHLTDDSGNLTNVEVKAMNGTRNNKQIAKDNAMATEGGTIVGKNAPDNLRGQTVKIKTEERRVP
jgi:RHS repeat-associated protein